MKLRNKKGFTIIELVIVIAVIGILTAVLVPTFINLTNKANEAADQSLVKNLNTALKMEEQTAGHKKAPTLQGAIDDLKEQGYLLENIVSKSGQDLLWNQVANEFVLNKDQQLENPGNYWQIVNQLPELAQQKYSYYAGKNFAATVIPNFKYGFDAGEHTGITSINYTNATSEARTVAVRTNGTSTTFTVNAPLDTVHHYDYLDGLTVTAIAGGSYHEHGTIRSKAVLSQGHIEVEQGAKVPEVAVNSVPDGKTAKVTANAETLVTADTTSASKVSIVANVANVFASGVAADKISGSKASEVELPTVVTTEEQLVTALANNKKYIQLGANFEVASQVVVNQKALLDFAGYTISTTLQGTSDESYVNAILNQTAEFEFANAPLFVNKSSLIITDTKANGGITSSNSIILNNEGDLTVNGGTFNSTRQLHKYYSGRGTYDAKKDPSTWELSDDQNNYRKALNKTILRGVVRNDSKGTIVVNNINITTKSDFGFLNCGKATINGGYINSIADNANGGYGYSLCQRDGEILVNYIRIDGVHGGFSFEGGKGTVNNALVTLDTAKNSFYALYIAGETGYPEVIINGGEYHKGKYNNVLYVGNKSDGGEGNLAMANVYGGDFDGGVYCVLNSANNYGIGMLKIYGGHFTIDPSHIKSGNSGAATYNLVAEGHSASQNGDGTWTVK